MKNRYYVFPSMQDSGTWCVGDNQGALPVARRLTQRDAERVAELLNLYGIERFPNFHTTSVEADPIGVNDHKNGRRKPEYPVRLLKDVQENEEWRYTIDGVWWDRSDNDPLEDLLGAWVEVRPASKPATEVIPWHKARGRKAKFGDEWLEVGSVIHGADRPRIITKDGWSRRSVDDTVEVLAED